MQATDTIFAGAQEISFIPDAERLVDYIAEQQITSQQSSLQLKQKHHRRVLREAPTRVGGLLIVTDASSNKVAYQVDAVPDPSAPLAISRT